MMNNEEKWPPLPQVYRLPPVVNPIWRLSDLAQGVGVKEKLRETIRQQYGVKHCLLLDRARSGLYLLIKGMGLTGEWISTSFMHRPASVVIKNHVDRLVLASINEDFNMDVEDVKKLITGKTQTILVSHMYGKAADVISLRSLADRYGLFLIENAVHMPGNVEIENRKLGSWGDAAILSFNVDKPVGAILGGALITNRDDVWEAVRRQDLGKSNGAECWNRVYNTYLSYYLKPMILRLDKNNRFRGAKDGVKETESFDFRKYTHYTPLTIHALQAAAALSGLKRSKEIVRRRIQNAEFLTSLLADNDKLTLPNSCATRPHTYLYYPVILVEDLDRYAIGCRLSDLGIETKWRYYPLHLQPGFTDCRASDMTKTMSYWQRHLLLPCGPQTNERQLKYLADSLLGLL